MDEFEIIRRYYKLFLAGIAPPVECPAPECDFTLMAQVSTDPDTETYWECWSCNRKFFPGIAFYRHLEDLILKEEANNG